MDKHLTAVIIVVTLFTGFLIAYSVPPFIDAGVFSGRKEKGVESKIDQKMEQYYKDLYKSDDDR